MREIKFRAWDEGHNHMMSWEELNRYDTDGHTCFLDILDGTYSEITPMQFTGLKDANGVEIYEGDIIAYKYLSDILKGQVKWDDSRAVFFTLGYSGDGVAAHGEVIGNIYENPELLK